MKKSILTAIAIFVFFLLFSLCPYSFFDWSTNQLNAEVIIKNYEHIKNDTIWTAEEGPYLIEGFSRVFSGVKLIIKPGTIVKLYEKAALYTSGELFIEGTEENPVIFTSIYDDEVGTDNSPLTNQSPWPGSWGTLGLQNGGSLTIDHAIFKYGGLDPAWVNGLKVGVIFAWHGTVNITNSEFTENIRSLYNYWNYYPVSIHNSKIYNNQLGGILNNSYTIVDAINNWWGDDSGPYHPTLNPDGIVDAIQGFGSVNILFDPWIGKSINQAPILSYSEENGYKQDSKNPGINPNKGIAGFTEFVFKIIYIDMDNDAPDDISVVVKRNGATTTYVMKVNAVSSTAVNLQDGDYTNGEQYIAASTFPQGKYQYYFISSDGTESVRWPETGTLDFDAGYSNIVFLPGIKASRLYTEGTIFENQLWEPNRTADVEKLFLDKNGNSLNPDIYTRDVINEVDILGSNIYETFLDQLDNMVAGGVVNNIKIFPYDWRMGIDDIVSSVIKTDIGGYSMTQEIEKMASSSQSGQVTIVAHSMGGLVAKRLISRMAELGKENLVDKLILVATPQSGTPDAVAGLLHGDGQDLPKNYGFIMDKPTAREFGENMKSAYSLLPSVRYFKNAEMPIIEFDKSSSFLENMRNYYGDIIISANGLNNFLLGREGRSEPAIDDIDTPNVLSTLFLDQALNLHASLDIWSPPQGLSVIQIASWGLDTIRGIRYKEKIVLVCPNNNYDDMSNCDYVPAIDREPIFSVNGDEVVMLSSAEEINDAQTYFLDLKANNKWFRKNRKHASIMEVESLLALFENIVTHASSALPEYIYANKEELSQENTRLRVSAHSPVSLDIYDSSGRHTGLADNPNSESDMQYVEEHIPNSYYLPFGEGKYTGVGSNDEYRIEFQGQDYGTFTLKITEVTGDNETMIVYQDVPVTPRTKAKLTVETLENKSALEIDMNGDGQIDIEIDSPEETLDPLYYIDMMLLSIENMDIEKHIEKYLLKKFGVIKKQIEKSNPQAAKAIIYSVEKYMQKKTKKFIPAQEARILLEMIGNLKNLMI